MPTTPLLLSVVNPDTCTLNSLMLSNISLTRVCNGDGRPLARKGGGVSAVRALRTRELMSPVLFWDAAAVWTATAREGRTEEGTCSETISAAMELNWEASVLQEEGRDALERWCKMRKWRGNWIDRWNVGTGNGCLTWWTLCKNGIERVL